MNAWLDNVELAFPAEPLSLREWLPILDAGLANLTVGVIPPALDQVFIGAIDRSRNPDIKLALVLGLNESLFPAPPETTVLLTEADRLELEKRNIVLGATVRQQLGRERYYAYIACTRARQRLVLTGASHNANGAPLNPSPFLVTGRASSFRRCRSSSRRPAERLAPQRARQRVGGAAAHGQGVGVGRGIQPESTPGEAGLPSAGPEITALAGCRRWPR